MDNKLIATGFLSILLIAPSITQANENLLWVGYNINNTDFFMAGEGEIEPTGSSVGFSTGLSENTLFTISYGDLQGDVMLRQSRDPQSPVIRSGDIDNQSLALAFSWLADDYALTFSYGMQDSLENSTTRFPSVIEKLEGEDQIFSFSFDQIYSADNWGFGYSVGSQYAVSEITLNDLIGTDPIIEINGQYDIESWSAFADIDLSIAIKTGSLTISPQLSLSWNWELSSSGDELLTITRGDEQRTISRLTDSVVTTFRTPDSGLWKFGVDLDWPSGWGVSLAYAQTIAAERDVNNLSFDINVVF